MSVPVGVTALRVARVPPIDCGHGPPPCLTGPAALARRRPRRRLSLETSAEHSAKSEGMICPIALGRGRGCHLLNAPAQPKHDPGPCPFGCCVRSELLFQASLEPPGIGFLVFGGGRVQEYGGKSSQFPVNSRGRPCIFAYWHLPHPAIESTATGRAQACVEGCAEPKPEPRSTPTARSQVQVP
jgi:hypothetical protein